MAKYVTNKNVNSRYRKMALVQKLQIMEFVQIHDFAAVFFTLCVLQNSTINFYVVSLIFDNQLYHILFWSSWYNVRNTAVESPSHTIFTTYLIFSFLSMFIGPNYVVCPIDHAISPSKRNYLKLYGVQYERKSVIQFLIIIIIVTMPHHGYLS